MLSGLFTYLKRQDSSSFAKQKKKSIKKNKLCQWVHHISEKSHLIIPSPFTETAFGGIGKYFRKEFHEWPS